MGFIEEIEEDYNKKQEQNQIKKTLLDLKIEILTLIKDKKTYKATELLTDHIKENNKIYTIRDDSKAEMWIYKEGIYIPNGATYIEEIVRQIIGNKYSKNFTREIIEKIQADTFIESEEFFSQKDKFVLCIQNGLLNIKTRELTKHTSDKIYFTKIPVKYDPTLKCPNFLKHLQTVLRYEQEEKVIQEMFGYCLYADYSIEKSFMLLGTGRNGKSKTLEVLKTVIGHKNCTNISLQELETDQWSKSELFGKLVNIAGDIGNQTIKDSQFFKGLTGHDQVSANRKFKTKISFTNHAKMIFSANQLPKTLDTTVAFFDRWIMIDFPYTFKPQKEIDELKETDTTYIKPIDTEIIKKLTTPEEVSGIFNWALDGLDRILEAKQFSYSKNTEEVKNMWLRKSDSFTAFTMDMIEIDFDKFIEKQELRRAYTIYCQKYKLKPVGDLAIKNSLTINLGVEEGQKRININSEYDERPHIWLGIKFKEEQPLNNLKDLNIGLSRSTIKNEKIKEEEKIIETKPTSKRITKEQLINLLEKNNKEMYIEDLIKEGLTEEQIEIYTGEGLISENHQGKINLI